MKFVVIPELRGRWIWELKDDDGRTLSRSTMSYGDREQALKVIQAMRRAVLKAPIIDPLGGLCEDPAAPGTGHAKPSANNKK